MRRRIAAALVHFVWRGANPGGPRESSASIASLAARSAFGWRALSDGRPARRESSIAAMLDAVAWVRSLIAGDASGEHFGGRRTPQALTRRGRALVDGSSCASDVAARRGCAAYLAASSGRMGEFSRSARRVHGAARTASSDGARHADAAWSRGRTRTGAGRCARRWTS